jgi:hypothetical protein
MGKARSNPKLQAIADKTAPVVNAGAGTAKGRRTAAGVGTSIVAGAGTAAGTHTATGVGTAVKSAVGTAIGHRVDPTPQSAKVWIVAEIARMKANNEILPGIRITPFSQDLARRMAKAAQTDESLRPIKARTIENRLRDWGFWPITSIK